MRAFVIFFSVLFFVGCDGGPTKDELAEQEFKKLVEPFLPQLTPMLESTESTEDPSISLEHSSKLETLTKSLPKIAHNTKLILIRESLMIIQRGFKQVADNQKRLNECDPSDSRQDATREKCQKKIKEALATIREYVGIINQSAPSFLR
jgi:hypothetical protein